MTVRFFYPVSSYSLYIIRCNPKPLLVLLVCLCKIFQRTLSLLLARSVFLKSECKSTNYFPFHQIFRGKSFKKVMILTRIHILRRSRGQNSLYYTCTRLRGRGRTHTSALIYAYYNKIQSRLTSTSIHFLSLSTRDSPQLKTENSIPYIFWRSSKDYVATAIKSSSDRHKIFWRSPKDCVTYAMQSL